MGRGNVNVHGEYEGLYYVDRDYLDCYVSKEANDDGEYEHKMLGDMTQYDFDNFDYDYDLSNEYTNSFIDMFVERIEKKFNSFVSTGDNYDVIMENALFEIKIVDNEWSYAVELIQKESDYDDCLIGLQKKHYRNYLDGIKTVLLGMFPEISCYDTPWAHRVIKACD